MSNVCLLWPPRAGRGLSGTGFDPARLRGVDRFGPAATWSRLLLPEVLPGLDKVLYLDSDVVVTDPLRPLWDLDLTDHALAAVSTVFPAEEWGRRHCEALGISRPELYFSTGVMLMNLAHLRAERCTPRALDYALANCDPNWYFDMSSRDQERLKYVAVNAEQLTFVDQDVLNALFADSRLELHPRWNCTNNVIHSPFSGEFYGERTREEAVRNPAIRHFNGGAQSKPWEPDGDPEDRRLYWSYRNRTPWAGGGA